MSLRISVTTASFLLLTAAACTSEDAGTTSDDDATATATTTTTTDTTGDGSGDLQPTTSSTAPEPTSGTTGPGTTATTTEDPDTDGTGGVTESTTDPIGTTADDTTGTTTDDTTGTTTDDTAGTTTDDTPGTTTDDTTGTTTDDTAGTTTDDTTDGVGFPDDAIFVHIGVGLDSNPGTQDEPKRTIQAGISAAVMAGASAVYIAEGTYDVDYQDNEVIVVQDGVSLFGGYKADDWGVRDPALHPSLIVDKSTTGGTSAEPNRALDGGTGVGPDTVVDGLTIQGGTGATAAAVYIEASNPTFTGNVMLGGAADDLRTFGLYVRAAAPVLKRNRIEGGDGPDVSTATGAYFSQSSAHVEANTILAGRGWYARGVVVSDCDLVLYNNVIHGGTSPGFNGNGFSTAYARAVSILGGAPTVAGNTILTGSSLKGDGIRLSLDASPHIDGNIITYAARCVFENDQEFKAASLRNNDLRCTVAAYETGDMIFTDLMPLETALNSHGTLASGNVKIAPTFVGNGDYHLEGMGQTVCELAAGGLDQSQLFTADHDGAPRTVPWTIGAFELDGPCQ